MSLSVKDFAVKVVIITNLGQKQKSAYNAENRTDLSEFLQVPFYVVFHNLEHQNQGLVDVKGIYIKKYQREFLCAKIKKKKNIVIKNVIWSEKTLLHKAVHPSNYVFPILSHIIRLNR